MVNLSINKFDKQKSREHCHKKNLQKIEIKLFFSIKCRELIVLLYSNLQLTQFYE